MTVGNLAGVLFGKQLCKKKLGIFSLLKEAIF